MTEPETAPDGDGPALAGELSGRLDKIEAQLTEFHRRSAHRESVIDQLHEENQRLRTGMGRLILEPVVTDLIRLHDQLVREVRRPRHSANLIAWGDSGRLGWGASLAYVGGRRDMDVDLFPAATVRLHDYLLASLRVAYRIMPALELYARVENAFDADYQDVVGYNTAGRTVYAGLRVAFGH